MKKYLISSMMVAVATLFCTTANAQILNFLSATANKGEGVNLRFQTRKAESRDTVHVIVEYALVSSFVNGAVLLKEYRYADSFKNVIDSLDGNDYNLPAPGTSIYLRMRMYSDTASWTPLQTLGSVKVTLKQRPAMPKITVVTKPFATTKGAVTALNVSSNVDFALRKYLHFKDSAKVFSSGVIQTLQFTAGTYTVSDTMFNLTQSSWLAYDVINEVGSVKTAVMKVGQYVNPEEPWGQFDSLVGYANNLKIAMAIVGNTLPGNTSVSYKHENDVSWSSYGPYAFTGNGVEKIAANIPVTKTGKWRVCFSATNSMGTFYSDTIVVNNTQSPASSVTVTPLSASYDGPGRVVVNFRTTVTTGEFVDIYAMLAQDTMFSVSESIDKPVRVTTSGDQTLTFKNVSSIGNLWVTLYYVTKSGEYVGRVRPYLQVKVDFGAGVNGIETKKVSIFPNPTTIASGFMVITSKTETLTMFDANGRTVFQKTVTDHELVTPQLPAGLYYYKIGTVTGKIIFN